MQSSWRPLAPVPRSPPLGPQNSVLSSTRKVRSVPFAVLIVKLTFFESTDLTVPVTAFHGSSNFLHHSGAQPQAETLRPQQPRNAGLRQPALVPSTYALDQRSHLAKNGSVLASRQPAADNEKPTRFPPCFLGYRALGDPDVSARPLLPAVWPVPFSGLLRRPKGRLRSPRRGHGLLVL
jgi:hypothetical protein